MTEQRRLAAIVSADVAGYSRLMGAGTDCLSSGSKQTSFAQSDLYRF
jgi:hypothetical protein